MDEQVIARMYLKEQAADRVVLNIPGTNYELHLRPTSPVETSPQGRVRGVVRLPVWKLDSITAGGAFIEPVYGRPRRVQGNVTGVLPETNSVVLDVQGQPIIGDLPPRWIASDLVIGSRVGLDVKEGGTFEPIHAPAAHDLGHEACTMVNLSAT